MTSETLTLCMLGNISRFFNRLLIFFKCNLSKNSFRNTTRMSYCLDPDQARRFVGSDLGSNFSHRLSGDDTSRQRVYNERQSLLSTGK